MGDAPSKRREPECEAAILTALARPLSERELYSVIAGRRRGKKLERVLRRLLETGAVIEVGTRRSFDFGVERMLKAAKSTDNILG